jgi:2-hydroxy-3-keto-5-methylthiopentenyl-1-phosphate phosphatase
MPCFALHLSTEKYIYESAGTFTVVRAVLRGILKLDKSNTQDIVEDNRLIHAVSDFTITKPLLGMKHCKWKHIVRLLTERWR